MKRPAAKRFATNRLAIVAHFDSRGGAAPHFIRQLQQLRESYAHVLVVTPSSLTAEAEAAITEHAELFRRSNYGHDFGSWRDGLERMNWGQDFDELLLTNDSYIGFFRPLPDILDEMSRRTADVWGMTKTARRGEHVQSYFLHFTSPALHSQAFRRFWMDARPMPDRMAAIVHQEVGISTTMLASGFELGAYFEPSRAERLRANARGVHWLYQRQRAFPARYDSLSEEFFSARRWFDPAEADNLNTSSAYADSVFDGGRLPVVKLDVLRNDPFWLGSANLLDDLERRRPDLMAGVRDYLGQMAEDYAARPYENHRYAHLSLPVRAVLGYGRVKGGLSLLPATRRLEVHA